MTQNEIISFLIRNGTIIKIGEDDFKYTKDTDKVKTIVLTPNAILDRFIKDSKIPFDVTTTSGIRYPLTAKSDYAKRFIYNEVITNVRFKYEDMIKATELYYNDPKMARVPLTKFFKEGLFEQVMENYLSGNLTSKEVIYNKTSL